MKKLICAFVVMACAAPAAHHGLTGADATTTITVRGAITDMEWQNPHVTVTVAAQGAGGRTERWVVSLMPPSVMSRRGLERGVLKIGSLISATGYAATSSNALNSVEFTLPDGRTFTTGNEKWRPAGGR